MTTDTLSLILLLHGESGTGKTPISNTTPAPRLVLDVEGGSLFVKARKVSWNPLTEAPPEHDGTWDTCVVKCRDWSTFESAYSWLNSGKHPFVSVTVDSITELQKRCRDAIRSGDVFSEQQWGFLLDKMEKKVREFRDLRDHPTRPLQAVVFVALTDQIKGKFRPQVQGRLSMNLPGLCDVIGYLYTEADENGIARRMLIQPTDQFVAKDRTTALPNGGLVGKYGPVIPGPINVVELLETINAEETTHA